MQRMDSIDSPLSHFVGETLTFFAQTYKESQGFDAPPVHDPCCLAKLIDPAVFETRDAFVAVELAGTWTSGMTVTDFGDANGREHNTQVATVLDRKRFWDLTVEAVRALSATADAR